MARLVKGRHRPRHPRRNLDGHRTVSCHPNDTLVGFCTLSVKGLNVGISERTDLFDERIPAQSL